MHHEGIKRSIPVIDGTVQTKRTISQRPSSYTNVPPSSLRTKDPFVPPVTCQTRIEVQEGQDTREHEWLHHVQKLVGLAELSKDDFISWAAFNASTTHPLADPPTVVALMPLFVESAHNVAMILHAMNVVKSSTEHLNSGQVPVIAMDQPLFAIAKTIQWNFPATHGEDKFMIIFGGLHIEMALFRTVGDWLQGSGWTEAIQTAGIATPGVADSLIKVSHLKKQDMPTR